MCFGGGDGGASAAAQQAAALRNAEVKRQGEIRQGQGGIDQAFSQFDPAYYDKFRQTYVDNYTPQIADQYEAAKGKLVSSLAGRGMLESTTGAHAIGLLGKTRNDAEADIGNRGVDSANAMRKQVEDTKTNLYGLNQSAADPKGVSAQAIGQASAITAPATTSPLGNVFASALNSFNAFNKADATGMNPRMPWNTFSAASPPTGGRGSGSIYG